MGLTAFMETEKRRSLRINHQSCMSHGINMFDTAEAYAVRVDDGKILHLSVLGKAIASIGRDKMVICTKHSRVRPA